MFDVYYYSALQCRMQDSIPSDDEYRSSRNIAISLFRRYRNVVDRGGGANLKVYTEFSGIFVCFSLFNFFHN